MDLVGTLGGGAMGALFGAVGSALNRGIGLFEAREKRRDRQLEMAHEKDRWAHESAAQAQANAGARDLAAVQGSWSGLAASLEAEAGIELSYRWVAAVRALTRPALTLILWLVFVAVLFLPRQAGDALAAAAIDTVSFSAATALAWWFGDRARR